MLCGKAHGVVLQEACSSSCLLSIAFVFDCGVLAQAVNEPGQWHDDGVKILPFRTPPLLYHRSGRRIAFLVEAPFELYQCIDVKREVERDGA